MDIETRQLQQLLSEAGQQPEVLLLKPVTESTNDDVREIALKGVQSVLVCSTRQTQGRGQRQRHWVSPEGNIYLSTVVNTRIALDGRLALETALNILQMPGLQNLDIQVKWPNDLYSPLGKWGGILIEPINSTQAVIGVGINLAPVPKEQIDQHVTSLAELGLQHISRIQLIAELYLAIQQAGKWFSHNSANLAQRFNHHTAFMDRTVTFTQNSEITTGTFKGIQNDGAVLIETVNGTVPYYQGSLKLSGHAE
jgi:BirA family biotin operon repressor/biotin-[acetyl-CoA-carboxylase] ligase